MRRLKRKLKSCAIQCRVADEPVVVMKFRPMKAREGVEDKTETTCCLIGRVGRWPKASAGCEGGKFIRKSWTGERKES